MTHLTQALSRCVHVHTVHSQDGGQPVTLHVWKENNWDIKPSPKAALLCGARFLPIYYLAVYVHTLDPFIWYSGAWLPTYHPFLPLHTLRLHVFRNVNTATECINVTWLNIFHRFFSELYLSLRCKLWFSHVNLINTMATHQAAPFMHTEQLHHGGCGEEWRQARERLWSSVLNASCLAGTHQRCSLSQTIPSKAYSLNPAMGSLY